MKTDNGIAPLLVRTPSGSPPTNTTKIFRQPHFFDEHHEKPKSLPNLILLDINMPQMSGWEFMEELKKRHLKEFKIFMVSSSIDSRDIERAKSTALVDGFLSKPINVKQVLEAL